MLPVSELDYDLPPGAVATRPADPRDSARLMVVSRTDERRVEHRTVRDLPGLLQPADLMVFNRTRVLPARLEGERQDTGGRVEGLFLGTVPSAEGVEGVEHWSVLLRGRRLKEGVLVTLNPGSGPRADSAALRLVAKHPDEAGGWIAEVVTQERRGPNVLEGFGRTPLPPYILRARREAGVVIDDAADRQWYQTVFAEEAGSVAAPTAGLHFTPRLLEDLERHGVKRSTVVLHVGTGTFRPVETEFLDQHPMHAEWCRVGAETASAVAGARSAGGRVLAVGTTSARALESWSDGDARDSFFETRLLITPGYRWRVIDGLLTNFHLPRSTLLALVAALFPAGAPRIRALYREAIERGYRFYSYGDAMLILP